MVPNVHGILNCGWKPTVEFILFDVFITIKSVWPLEASPDDFVFFSISTMSSAELDALLQRGAATLKSASGLEIPPLPSLTHPHPQLIPGSIDTELKNQCKLMKLKQNQ